MDKIELIKLAYESKPELLEKVAANVKLIEALAPEFSQEVFQEIADVVTVTKTKVAGLKEVGALLGGSVVAALGGAIAADLFDVAKRGLSKTTNYRRIIDVNPDLKTNFNTERLKSSFDVIHRYAPEFTADPIMGGSILRAVAELPGQEVEIIKGLIKSRSELLNAKKNQFDIGTATKNFARAWEKKDTYGN